MIANFHGFRSVTTVEGVKQLIPGGPVAGFVAIKQIGSNGGGFFNVNSAHPFENPTQLANFVELYLTVALAFALAVAFGVLVKDKRQGRMVLGIMAGLWLVGLPARELRGDERQPPPRRRPAPTSRSPPTRAAGTWRARRSATAPRRRRSGAPRSTLTSNGSVNSMHDSWTPLGSIVPFFGMLTGEVTPGGVGVGLMGLLVNVLFAVFIAGLMIGRTPEYLGKKLQAQETKLIVLYLLAVPAVLLGFTGGVDVRRTRCCTRPSGTRAPTGSARSSTRSARRPTTTARRFAGITANTQWMNTTLGLAMLVGRFFLIIPVLAIAGSLARKPTVPTTSGTLATHTARVRRARRRRDRDHRRAHLLPGDRPRSPLRTPLTVSEAPQ